jgi:hypothetical protein
MSQTKAFNAIMYDLCSSEMLYSIEWSFCTAILGQPLGPIFKSQVIWQRKLSMTEGNWLFLGGGGAISIIYFFKGPGQFGNQVYLFSGKEAT